MMEPPHREPAGSNQASAAGEFSFGGGDHSVIVGQNGADRLPNAEASALEGKEPLWRTSLLQNGDVCIVTDRGNDLRELGAKVGTGQRVDTVLDRGPASAVGRRQSA